MKIITIRHTLAILALTLLAPLALAADDGDAAVKTMAGILAGLNHFPSADQKAELQAIASDTNSSDATKTIAQAIHDMQHSVSAADKEKLQAIASDANASEGEKTLAEVLAGISHQPSAEAKAKLEKL